MLELEGGRLGGRNKSTELFMIRGLDGRFKEEEEKSV